MRRRAWLSALAMLGWLAAPPAFAQQSGAVQLSDDQVRQAIVLALRNIDKAMCGQEKCAAANADEFDHPPLTADQARSAIETGVLSGTAQWCGLDWQKGLFVPAMQRFGKEASPTERQRALFALLEGIYQGQVVMGLQPRGVCPSDVKTRMEARLAKYK